MRSGLKKVFWTDCLSAVSLNFIKHKTFQFPETSALPFKPVFFSLNMSTVNSKQNAETISAIQLKEPAVLVIVELLFELFGLLS